MGWHAFFTTHTYFSKKSFIRSALICNRYTQRNRLLILVRSPETRLYWLFSEFIWRHTESVWLQINRKMVNTIWFRFDLMRFGKYFFVCRENSGRGTGQLFPSYDVCLAHFMRTTNWKTNNKLQTGKTTLGWRWKNNAVMTLEKQRCERFRI